MADVPLWFDKGLPFKCTGCGQCCTGSPGYVWITEEEMQAVADYLKISIKEFMRKYIRRAGDRYALVEHPNLERPKDVDCVFLKDKKCTIYHLRPKQCKTFPWWNENLSSPKAWEELSSYCEGVNHPEADIVPLSEIQKNLQ
jgi:uncharacterized protein